MTKSKLGKQSHARKNTGVTFETVRRIALALPGVEEGTSYRTVTFRAGKRMIARFHQDGESLMLKVDYTAREVLTGSQPEMFYVTDHYRCWPYMLVRLGNVELNLLQSLIEDAWRAVASKRAIAAYEEKTMNLKN